MFAWFLGEDSNGQQFTIQKLQMVYNRLKGRENIVENLRLLSEFIIYGDQHAEAGHFFDFFCEKNTLAIFVQIANTHPSVPVQVQLLQTLSIILQNISSTMSLYYLLSNNYINQLISSPFNTAQEEVRDWYVTFLKALSLRLNADTVQFFFNSQANSFPLYTMALRFAKDSESMVRIAVRTLTLNVYRIQDDKMRQFICNAENSKYFEYIVDSGVELANKMQLVLEQDRLTSLNDEFVDYLLYVQDILETGIPQLCFEFGEQLFSRLCRGLLMRSLLPNCTTKAQSERISTLLALYLLSQCFSIISHAPMLNALCYVLLHPECNEDCNYMTASLSTDGERTDERTLKRKCTIDFNQHGDHCEGLASCYENSKFKIGDWISSDISKIDPCDGNLYRQAVLCLIGSSDERLSCTAMLLLCSVLDNKNTDENILREANLSPQRRHRMRNLLKGLTSSPTAAEGSSAVPLFMDPEERSGSCEDDDSESSALENAQGPTYWTECVHLLLQQWNCESRVLNFKMSARLLLDLVLDERPEGPFLIPEHTKMLQEVETSAALRVKELLATSNFLQLFLNQVVALEKEPFPIQLNSFSQDPMLLLATNDKEDGSVATFWLLRKLHAHLFTLPSEDTFGRIITDLTREVTCSDVSDVNLATLTTLPCIWQELRVPRTVRMVLDPNYLILVEDQESIVLFAFLDAVDVATDRHDTTILHLAIRLNRSMGGIGLGRATQRRASGQLWQIPLQFNSEEACVQAKTHIEANRSRLEEDSLNRIGDLLCLYINH